MFVGFGAKMLVFLFVLCNSDIENFDSYKDKQITKQLNEHKK